MRIRDLLIFVIGTAVGGGAVFYLASPREVVFPHAVIEPQTVRLLVAKKALRYGVILQLEHLRWVDLPSSAVPPGAFTSATELLGENGDQLRIVLQPIEPGEPILKGTISKPGESPRMSMNLSLGMRAVSIRIDAVSDIATFASTGDRVDVLLTRAHDRRQVSSVILRDIAIIAIGPHSTSKTLAPRLERMVTVAVDTAQAQKLALAQEVGRLSLILRVRGIGPPGDPYSDPSARPFRDLNEPFNPVIRRGIRLFEIGPERE